MTKRWPGTGCASCWKQIRRWRLSASAPTGVRRWLAIRKLSPDLVFLDMQMPELDGFGVLEALGDKPMPVIVFVTAHDKFALRAFEVHAVDYLLKPFDRERFAGGVAPCLRTGQESLGQWPQRTASCLANGRANPPPKHPSAWRSKAVDTSFGWHSTKSTGLNRPIITSSFTLAQNLTCSERL